MRRLLLLGMIAVAAPASAQYDPDAPPPIDRCTGTVHVYGEEFEGARTNFYERLQGRDVLLLLAPGTPVAEELARWASEELPPPEILALSRAEADDAARAREVAGVSAFFVVGDSAALGETYAGTAVGRALRTAVLGGAAVGIQGEAARVSGALRLGPQGLGAGFDLLQGAILDPSHVGGGAGSMPGAGLAAALEALPMFVGLGLEPTGHLDLSERWLGGVRAHAWVPAGAGRALRSWELGARGRADLASLSRSAQARALRPWPPAEPAPPSVAAGTLLLGGGPMPSGTIERFIDLAGGADAPIVYVPCVYAEALTSTPSFVRSLQRAGARNVTWIHTKDRRSSNGDPELLAQLELARGVWFGGGRQWNFVDSYLHTEAHRLIEAVLARGGVVGGSSAGASIQTDYLARGNPLGNADIMAEGYEEGLGLLTGVAVDQHFTQRGRLPDLQALVATYPEILGIGIDEGAVLLVRGSVAEVMGTAVTFVDGRGGERRTHRLVGGRRFDLAGREPLE